MAFLARRFFSTSVRARNMRHTVATPAPFTQEAVLESAELQQLARKAKGPWKELSKTEHVQLYRATFPKTMRELRAGAGDGMKVFIGVTVGILVGSFLATFLRNSVGPTQPHTFQNAEWEAATREKLLKMKSNPIEGISSRVAK